MPEGLEIIDSRYRILRRLGEGMTGDVYQVQFQDETLALKLLKPFGEKSIEDSLISAFKFEFGLLKDLRHPHVVGVREFGFDATLNRYYFTEEYIPGLALSDFAKQVQLENIAELFIQAIQGLQSIHRAHMLHGDLKASNLLILESPAGPKLKIIDLGLADPRLGLTAGTPSTMAPEKILGDTVDERADLYSLGITFYALFTGENPFLCDDYRRCYEAQLSHRPLPATRINPKIPAFWNEIFETLLEKNPANRYRSCEALLEAIDFLRPHGLGEKAGSRPWAPERWVERVRPLDGILEKIQESIRSSAAERPPVFLLSGEPGVGKSRTLQEIRYRLQMEKQRVIEHKRGQGRQTESEGESAALYLVDDWSSLPEGERTRIVEFVTAGSASLILLISCRPEETAAITESLSASGRESRMLNLKPFSRPELEEFLLKMTGLESIPATFLEGLWENTRGNPRKVTGLLEQFVRQRKLLDPHGTWHLSIFNEEGIDFTWLPREIPQIDQELLRLPAGEHRRRAELWIRRGEELTKQDHFGEAGQALAEAESESLKIPELAERFQIRAQLFEKKGFHAIRTGLLEDARRYFEKAQVFLEEIPDADPVEAIRLQNYLAWLLCKKGEIDRGIANFLEQGERTARLPMPDQVRVLNNELGFAYLLKGDIELAISTLEQASEFYSRVENASYYLKNLYNLAEAYLLAKHYQPAIEKYIEAAQEARFQKNFELLLRIYNGIGKAYHLQGDFEQGLSYYNKALELARYLGDLSSAAGIAQNIGSNFSEREDLKNAKEYLDLALKMLKKLPEMNAETKYFYCRALLERGDVFRKEQNFDEALGYVHEARILAFSEACLEFFRFWVVLTQSRIEKDRAHHDKFQSLLAELVSLANDSEQEQLCRELIGPAADSVAKAAGEASNEAKVTRIEDIVPQR